MTKKRISAYRVAVNDWHRNQIFTTKNLLPSQVASSIEEARKAYPENYIFVYKVNVDRDEETAAIIEPGKTKFVEAFERYEMLPDGKCRVSCEFGTWTARDKEWAQGAVSKLRHTQYWKTISPFDISREQD